MKGLCFSVQVKSEKWGDMFVDLLPDSEVETQSIVKVHLEEPPEPMVKRGNCFFYISNGKNETEIELTIGHR